MNVNFLTDMLQTIAERGRGVLGRAWPGAAGLAAGDVAGLIALCDALLSRRGEASGVAIAGAVLDGYARLDADGRMAFLDALEKRHGPDPQALSDAIEAYRTEPAAAALQRLQRAVESRRLELIRRLNLPPGGTAKLVAMREDMLRFSPDAERWPALEADFVHLLGSWFNRGFLVMRRISWETPANILEKIIRYEAVHAIGDWDDLRRRIEPDDRRLFGFFHPRLVDEPLIFVEVALTQETPDSIGALLEKDRPTIAAAEARTAAFYSISNCQEGLRRISFGHFLIKQVADDLKRELPNLDTFVTLSPAPGFAAWLAQSDVADDQRLAHELAAGGWIGAHERIDALRAATIAAAGRYLARAKRADGRPRDSVARFHLGNGAILERINWPADLSEGAIVSAHGVMVNYRYDLAAIERHHENYAEKAEVALSSAVRRLLSRRPALPADRVASAG